MDLRTESPDRRPRPKVSRLGFLTRQVFVSMLRSSRSGEYLGKVPTGPLSLTHTLPLSRTLSLTPPSLTPAPGLEQGPALAPNPVLVPLLSRLSLP